MTCFITHRGEEQEIEYTIDDDPSTNSCEVEWCFCDPTVQYNEQEEDEIINYLISLADEPGLPDDVI